MSHRGDVTDPSVSPRPGVRDGDAAPRIVDIDGGQQPKLSANGRILVSFNGEIYNHVELRRELETLGLAFRSDSDTEVLANALSVWGPAALQRIEGMYAFVAYDAGAGEFLAARDPFGVKPLYLIERGGGYLFASEIRPLLSASEIGNVLLLPPGHWFTRRALQPFARPHAPPVVDVRTLDKLMRTAVHSRVPPDLPFALLFSGGIDSSLVAHYARELDSQAPGYFLGDELAPDFEFAARYADADKLDLRVTPMTSPRNLSRAHLAESHRDHRNFRAQRGARRAVQLRAVRKIHADGFRVALSGEGADELFAATSLWRSRSPTGVKRAITSAARRSPTWAAPTCNGSTAAACASRSRRASHCSTRGSRPTRFRSAATG